MTVATADDASGPDRHPAGMTPHQLYDAMTEAVATGRRAPRWRRGRRVVLCSTSSTIQISDEVWHAVQHDGVGHLYTYRQVQQMLPALQAVMGRAAQANMEALLAGFNNLNR